MITFQLKNKGMGADSFSVLIHSATRVLGMKGLSLSEKDATYTVLVSVDTTLSNDRYVICVKGKTITLRAANNCAAHAAFGRYLLECRFDGKGGFTPPADGVIDFTPARPLRGMYFATHFHNFYHVAPLPEVYEVIEDLALRGCNTLALWFDMHHYTSMKDEGAVKLVTRLHQILAYANKIGIGGALTAMANEAFADSPEELRAEWHAQGRYHTKPEDHYHLELCPSKEGGLEKILQYRREMLECFKDLKIDYITYWPYDQGGCTCEKCQPWGSRGFMKILPHFKALVKELMPETKVIVATWYFDRFVDGEWDEFYPQMSGEVFDDIPYVMSFFFRGEMPECIKKNGIPANVKFIDFPEISMYTCTPWGGFGASVLTHFLDKTNTACAHLYEGGFPYSEGIFEDANKFIEMSFYSGLHQNAFDALRAWVRFEFCCEDEELYQAILKTETAISRGRDRTKESYFSPIHDTSDVEFVYETMEKYNKLLPERVTSSRNFRLFYLRAVIDHELSLCGFYPLRSKRCQDAMREVDEIYHVDEHTFRWVRTPYGT